MNAAKPEIIKIKGGSGFERLLCGSPQTAGMRAGYVEIAPGQSVGEHSTDAKEEGIVILEGTAELISENIAPLAACPGSLIYVPPYTRHNLRNTGEGALRYVYITAPAAGACLNPASPPQPHDQHR